MTKNKTTTPNPHDVFFKTAMKDKRVARDFLTHYLPKLKSIF